MKNCQFCGTEHTDEAAAKLHHNADYVFCNVGPTGHSCWSQYLQYVERFRPTPYEQTLENAS